MGERNRGKQRAGSGEVDPGRGATRARPIGLRSSRLLVAAVLTAIPALAQERTATDQVIDQIVVGEKQFLAQMKDVQPFLETYIQELDPKGLEPVRDHYMLMRLDAAKSADETILTARGAFGKPGRGNRLTFRPAGWARMVFLDTANFDRSTYKFEFARREFLGDVRCLVFEVAPLNDKERGRFVGNIWVDDQDYRIVRFNGTYTQSKRSDLFFHFDAWRVNAAPDFWAPAFIYVEEGNQPAKAADQYKLKAQVRLWGYGAKRGTRLDELSAILIESKTAVDDKSSQDVSPVESQRAWERQAEQNVIDRLERSGLLAPKGEVDKILNTVVNNLAVTNKIDMDVQCRVILTTPLETFSIGKTIVISRGLLDVLPDEASLALVLSEELAHIAMGHRTPTAFAFGDQTMFGDRDILARLNLKRSAEEMSEAGRKSIEMLANSPYKDKLSNAGLFLKAIESRVEMLPNLVQANLGNQFANRENLQRLIELAQKAPPLDAKKMEQIAALPLGSRVKVNAWTNQISLIKTEPLVFTSAREKMPFEVTPQILHLSRIGTEPSIQAHQTGTIE